MALLNVKKLSKSFITKGIKKDIFTDVDLSINNNEIVGLIGDTGCGKTTLLKCIMGIYEADEGDIFYRNIEKDKDIQTFKKEVQLIFQNARLSLNPRLTIGKNIREAMTVVSGLDSKKYQKKICEMLNSVGLASGICDRYPHQVSGGQAQRAVIARALVLEPKLIIADEPVSSLDVCFKVEILRLILELKKKYKFSILCVSHDKTVINAISNKIYSMEHGMCVLKSKK